MLLKLGALDMERVCRLVRAGLRMFLKEINICEIDFVCKTQKFCETKKCHLIKLVP